MSQEDKIRLTHNGEAPVTQSESAADGAWFVARLLAGAPAAEVETVCLDGPWADLAQALVQAGSGGRLAAYEAALSRLPGDRAVEIRALVGQTGRDILHGPADGIPPRLPLAPGRTVPDLPQAARTTPEMEAQAVEAGRWLEAYKSFACDISPLTPPELHESAGLWLGSVAIARRVRLRLRHDDLFPNLLVLWVCDTTVYAKTTGLNIAKRLARTVFPHLLAVSEFSPEALLDDFAGRQPLGLQDLPEEDRCLWTERRNFAGQRGVILDESASLFISFKRDYNAGLPYYLLRLSDCDPEVEKLTRGSGKVVAHNTYLSFLGSTTAAALVHTDLDFLWGSGLWPRFALLTPNELPPWRSPLPGCSDPPEGLTRTLRRLAEEKLPRPIYPAVPQARDVHLADGVHAAWRAYAKAMIRDILTSREAPDRRLWGIYGRLPGQAFKVAVILAALDWAESDEDGMPVVSLAHWTRGQMIAESWRASAHRLLDSLSNRRVVEEHDKEDRILHMVQAAGPGGLTARTIYRTLGWRRAEFDLAVASLVRDGLIREVEIKPARGPSACGYAASENLSLETTGLTP